MKRLSEQNNKENEEEDTKKQIHKQNNKENEEEEDTNKQIHKQETKSNLLG
jgi:hypothetical protein